jgi:hypothetical protein
MSRGERPPHDPAELDPTLVAEYANEPDILRGMIGEANATRADRDLPPIIVPGIGDGSSSTSNA